MRPRWKKIFNDLWSSKSRTALVVISIFIGVFATGVISGARSIVVNELQRSYEATQPAHMSIRFSEDDSFGEDLVEVIRDMDGVAEAEGRRMVGVSMLVAPGDWEDLQLTVIPDFDEVRINQFRVLEGEPDPGDKEVLIERSSMAQMHVEIGDSLLVERSDGKQKILEIVGVLHDISVRPTSMSGAFYGYISPDTAEWLGESRTYTRLLLRIAPTVGPAVAAAPEDGAAARGMRGGGREQQMMRVVETVNEKIEKSGREPSVPRGPHGGIETEHWATSLIQNLSMMMSVLGVMSLFLSGFLVTNTIAALLAQQVKQIGIMKTVGARGPQIMLMYMVLVVGFGLLAMLLALPLTLVVTGALVAAVSHYFNFDLSGASFPTNVLLLQAFASVGIPVIASVLPVITGTRITIREALSSDGTQGASKKKSGQVGRFSLSGLLAHILSRPLILSIRNTFRRKMRVSLTLLTLTVGGLMFIGIFTIRNSLVLTLDQFIEREFNFDAVLVFERTHRDYYVIETALRVPGVVAAEAWSEGIANRVYESGWESEDITLNALPPDSQMYTSSIVKGRWLLPDDENAIVITTNLLEEEPDITVGDEIMLNINDEESSWVVVGVTSGMDNSRTGYVSYDYFSRLTGNAGKTRHIYMTFDDQTIEGQAAIRTVLEDYFESQSIDVSRMFSMTEMRDRIMAQFDFIVIALMVMALLMAIVGGLGLAGTMSLNVIERTREIGVMRAIGASNSKILQIFLGEGLLIGILSWMMGSSLSLPVSKLLSDAMGNLFFRQPLSFDFSVNGVGIWLALSVVLAIMASFFPAWNATRVSVRDVLAYE